MMHSNFHNFHHGQRIQAGKGIGSIFSSIFRKVIPVTKAIAKSSVGKTVKKSLSNLAINSAIDALEGKNLKESVQDNLQISKKKIADALRASNSRKRRTKQDIVRRAKRPKKYHILNN